MEDKSVFQNDVVKPPTLEFETNISDDDEEVEPIIFHPALQDEKQSVSAISNLKNLERKPSAAVSTQDIRILEKPSKDDTNKIISEPGKEELITEEELCKPYTFVKNVHSDELELPNVTKEITEIELDSALIDSSSSLRFGQETPSLGDSGSSNSSELGKLTECMKSLKEKQLKIELHGEHVQTAKDSADKDRSKVTIEGRKTLKIDLRSQQNKFPLHKSVAQRYRSSSETTLSDDLFEQRAKIKQDSLAILRSKGKSSQLDLCDKDECEQVVHHFVQSAESDVSTTPIKEANIERELSFFQMNNDTDHMSSEERKKAVDAMLENVDKIILKISDPGEEFESCDLINSNGDVKAPYESLIDEDDVDKAEIDNEVEFVQNYVTFDESTGKVSSIIEQEDKEQFTVLDMEKLESEVLENPLSIDTDLKTQVVGWDRYIDLDINTKQRPNQNSNSPVKKGRPGNVFDSLFTDSFLSASAPVSKEQPVTSTKPKRNILGTKKSALKITNRVVDQQSTVNLPTTITTTAAASTRTTTKAATSTSRGTSTDSMAVPVAENNDSMAEILKESNLFKEELRACEDNEMSKGNDAMLLKSVNRDLGFISKNKVTKSVAADKQQSTATSCLACMHNQIGETPLKHDTLHCKRLVVVKPTMDSSKSSDKGNLPSVVTSSTSVDNQTNTSQLSKNAKKKKRKKNNKAATAAAAAATATSSASSSSASLAADELHGETKNDTKQQKLVNSSTGLPLNNISIQRQNETMEKEITQIINELEELTKCRVLLHKDVSFGEAYSPLPPSLDKEFLLLKIALDSPGVVKGELKKAPSSRFDESGSHNFIGLVTLFTFLMYGNAYKYQFSQLDVPFDVVSMSQCLVEDDLYLVVGVCENEKTHKQKSKRTKLGSYFFHAVSFFLNTHPLQKLLSFIIPTQGFYAETSQNKLSSFINIVPDGKALRKLLASKESILVGHNEVDEKLQPPRDSPSPNTAPFLPVSSSSGEEQEMTCIFIENINMIPSDMVSAILKNISSQSLDIVGLKLAYVPSANNPSMSKAVLAICIMNTVTTSEQARLLFNTTITEVPVSFQPPSEDKRHQTKSTAPAVNCLLNESLAYKHIVQWFGPHFQDMAELKEHVQQVKSELLQNSNSQTLTKKKKWGTASDGVWKVSYACTFSSHAVVLVSSLVPSWFIPHVVSSAKLKGMDLRCICKNTVRVEVLEGLGITQSAECYGFVSSNRRKTTTASKKWKETGSFFYLLFKGHSAALKLNALVEHFTNYLNTQESTSPVHQTFDSQTLRTLLKKQQQFSFANNRLHHTFDRNGCFTVLHSNEQTTSQLRPSYPAVPKLELNDLRSQITATCKTPNVSLAAIVVHGRQLQSQFGNLLRSIFFTPNELLIESLVGIKLMHGLTEHDIRELSPDEVNTHRYKNTKRIMLSDEGGDPTLLIVLKTVDFLCTSKLKTVITNFTNSSKVDKACNEILFHSDAMYILNLMFIYFHPNELHHDIKVPNKLIAPAFLEDTHPLLTIFNKLYHLNINELSSLTERALPDVAKKQDICHEFKSRVPKKTVYQLQPLVMNYPCELLLREQVSYVGLAIRYDRDYVLSILKAVSRIIRLGFRIVAWKFPVYKEGVESVRVVFSRSDALYFMKKILIEIETSFQSLKFQATGSMDELVEFVRNTFQRTDCGSGSGGIFHINYLSLTHELYFTKDELIESRDRRSMEWHPMNSSLGRNSFLRYRSPYATTLGDSTLEVSVLLLANPLLVGKFGGKTLPRSCVFPELLQTFDEINYTCLASRMTSLDDKNADKVLDTYDIQDKKRRHLLKTFLTSPTRPFMAIVLIGPCIQSTFWLQIERMHCDEEDIKILKKFTLTTSSKKQVEYLVPAFFDHVLQNSKVEIHTAMTSFVDVESQLLGN